MADSDVRHRHDGLPESRLDGGSRALARPLIHAGVLIAGLCAALAFRVFPAFAEHRLKLVRSAIDAQSDLLDLPDARYAPLDASLRPLALILRIRNDSVTSGFEVISEDGSVCRAEVSPGSAERIDCAVRGHASRFTIKGPAPPWSVEYAELATHHGSTWAPYRVLILPEDRAFDRVPRLAVALVSVLIGCLAFVPPTRISRRAVRVVYDTASAAALTGLGLTLVSPWISAYVLALSVATWTVCALVVLATRLWALHGLVLGRLRASAAHRRAALACAAVLLAGMAFARVTLLSVEVFHQGNYSGFIHIDKRWFDRSPIPARHPDIAADLQIEDPGGYDAQFMYFHAFDPLVREFSERPERYGDFIDAPPYRLGRVGFPLLARAASLNQPRHYPFAMTWLIVAGVVASVAGMCAIAAHYGRSVLWGLGVVAVPGYWVCLQYGMSEPIAGALLIWGIYFCVRRRWLAAGALFALSLLVRETGAIAVICLAGAAYWKGDRRGAVLMAGAALFPLLVWRLYLGSVLYSAFGLSGYWYNPHVHGAPGAGLYELAGVIARGEYGGAALTRAAGTYALLFIATSVLSFVLAVRARSALAIIPALYAAAALCLTYARMWEHVGNVERGTFELFLLVPIALLTRPASSSRLVLGAFTALAAAYVLTGSIDAEFIRYALGLSR